VAKVALDCVFLSTFVICYWSLHRLDIKNVFLPGELEDGVYMEQPPDFVAQGESSRLVCRLCKLLYGLKQSFQAWLGKFNTVIQEFITLCFIDIMHQIQ